MLSAIVTLLASAGALAVPASREPLTDRPGSPVAHDTEVMALAAHTGRLFAATDQWEYPGPSPRGQVLVKRSRTAPWRVFESTQSKRVQALRSFPIPRDQGLGRGHRLLITQAIVHGRSRIQWLRDGAHAFTRSHRLPPGADVRSFGTHEAGSRWAVYAGASPTGILRGRWSRRRHTVVFGARPELAAPGPSSRGAKTQKVTGFADCGGALFASVNTKLYRRNDGRLRAGVPRWALVYRIPPVGAFNSGLRGLTCAEHRRSPALLVSTEGSGDVLRLGHLPRRRLRRDDGHRLTAVREFAPRAAIRRLPGVQGDVGYVIAAYNEFTTVRLAGRRRQLFGIEWSYAGGCPPTRACAPSGFDASACFAIRTDRRPAPRYSLRCLAGREFRPSRRQPSPVRAGQAFVAVRTVAPSPFGADRLYFGGYDCNFHPADGTAWIGSAAVRALGL